VAKDRAHSRRAWLRKADGGAYRRNPDAREFEILFQPREGALWTTVRAPDGTPTMLPLNPTPVAFLAAVAGAPGSYQLVPRDLAGRQRGDPPQRIDLVTGTDPDAFIAALDRTRPPPIGLRRRFPEPAPQPPDGVPASIDELRRRSQRS
jgi:hypothetical protein